MSTTSLSRDDVTSAIREFSELMGGPWSVPMEPGIAFMMQFQTEASMLTVSDTEKRYLGAYGNVIQAAQAYAAQCFQPANDEPVTAFTQINWDDWPFGHIDWFNASMEFRERIAEGKFLVVDELHYFDTTHDA